MTTDRVADRTGGTTGTRRRGRLPAQERERREHEVLQAATRLIIRTGYPACTMQAIADEARASKETLYSWFGDREGLIARVIRDNADASAAQVSAALGRPATHPDEARATLEGYARSLLRLLTGEVSVALNRAAMSSPALAGELLASGRHRVGPVVAAYLGELYRAGLSPHPDGERAFSLLYGLVVQDTQIRVLLGEDPPADGVIAARARVAVERFFTAGTE